MLDIQQQGAVKLLRRSIHACRMALEARSAHGELFVTISAPEYVGFLYRLLLRREPDAAGLTHWAAILDGGGSLDDVFASIWQSDEFAQLPPSLYLRKPGALASAPTRAPGHAVYFFHIPKTAGMSVDRYLARTFGAAARCPARLWDELMTMPREEVERYRVFSGHFQGYLIDYLPRSWSVLTLLRDPVERSLSCYYYARGNPDYPFHAYARALTLKEYCLHPATRWRIEDYQTACLLTLLWRSGSSFLEDCRASAGPELAIHRAIEASTASAVPSQVRFNLAKVALGKCAAVGITEYLAESLDLFSRVLQVPTVSDTIHEYRSVNRRSIDEIDRDTLQVIENLTRTDRLVYDYALTAFKQSLVSSPVAARATAQSGAAR